MIPRTSLVDVRSTFSGRLGCWLLFEISIRKSSPWSRRLLLQFTYVFPGFISCCITILHIQHHPILFQLNFLMWAIDQTQWCLPTSVTESTGSTWVNHHLASIHHVCEYNRNAKLWPAMFAHRIIYIYIFGRSMDMMASSNTVFVHITMRIGVHDLFCGRPFETPGFFHDQILSSMQGVGEWQKIQGCSGGHKVHDRFLEISTETSVYFLNKRPAKSRTLGVNQKFLIVWRPRYELF